MSVPFFLNPGAKPQEKPKTITVVRRIVAQPIESIKPPSQQVSVTVIRKFAPPPPAEPVSKPPPTPPKEQASYPSKLSDILAFCILSKILLTKNEIEKLNGIFSKLIIHSTPAQILTMKVNQIVDKTEVLRKIWQIIINKESSVVDDLYSQTKALINVFLSNNIPEDVIINHFSYIMLSIKPRFSFVHIFSAIVQNQSINIKATDLSKILSLTKGIIKLLRTHKFNSDTSSIDKLSFAELIQIDEPENPFDLLKKDDSMIPVVKASKPYTPKPKLNIYQMKHFSPSYVPFKININANENPIILNHLTKMFPVSVDIQGRYKPPPDKIIPVQFTDFFQILESIEVVENKTERVFAFSDNNPFISYAIGTAGRDNYGNLWSDIYPHISNDKVRKIVINRCRKNLSNYQSEHCEVVKTAESVFITRPINEFLKSILLSNMPNEFEFPFVENEVSMYIEHIIATSANHKIQSLVWFLNEVLSFIQMPNPIVFIHTTMFAGVLWLFSKLCSEIKAIFDATAIEMNTFDAVIDKAFDEIQSKSFPIPDIFSMHKPLTEILKSIVQFKLVSDEMRNEAIKHYGKIAIHISHFYPIIEKMNLICHFLRTDPHMKKLNLLMTNLGMYSNDDTKKDGYLDSRMALYRAAVKNISLYKLINIKLDRESGKVLLIRD
ncbi:hypothetical protein TVAG_303130 [Trichomonas vaginalis G3]|uniref:Uncharacterized protein n=1 Tax=Trichomonas vaginalis (strain ATCC PRA-98 / G3) TaxID=412133 RepID=A2DQZ5_TRIV3|nr:hypothetical protein TVAGG3_0694220 [Trichomonas vaginalis G3]EAY17094.1 hypothetical protein TVAG_303130 [Trichomonas vaginalis G3]KAI5508798.1 hypothetical protein TVAGG3_0694220 [Trichomonas vaginalis G3]|eukprot:XP_001329317.1 hypothetical protein [Trichomonas vaginalis G3]